VDGYTPGVDYPIYNSVPFGLAFTCGGKLPGYYADPEARCQVRPYGHRINSHFNISRLFKCGFIYLIRLIRLIIPLISLKYPLKKKIKIF